MAPPRRLVVSSSQTRGSVPPRRRTRYLGVGRYTRMLPSGSYSVVFKRTSIRRPAGLVLPWMTVVRGVMSRVYLRQMLAPSDVRQLPADEYVATARALALSHREQAVHVTLDNTTRVLEVLVPQGYIAIVRKSTRREASACSVDHGDVL